ncbi:MAG TPA: dTMP kinase [Thermoanaerobaculia bacterium]|jgi:dTMP kinase|nr:dTMP kinase [Thermoanaerobaculia bacterium]
MPPLFITFEGIDGSGKSTHLKRAAEWLAQHGVACRQTHEPGGTPLGDALRQLFLDRRWGALDGTVELLMLFASRRQHLLEVIEPALAAGEIVLCDRFTDSTRAYQGRGRGVPLDLIDQIDLLATGRRRPDRTLLFDLPAAAARARRHGGHPGDPGDPGGHRAVPGGRHGRSERAGRADRLDAEDLAFYERVRLGFLEQAEREPRRFRIVESGGDPARTAAQVRAALEDLLPAGVVRA